MASASMWKSDRVEGRVEVAEQRRRKLFGHGTVLLRSVGFVALA
jgi:hypothetical protein